MVHQREQPPDYYEMLQIHERAIPEVVERVYRVLARKYHPDVHPPERKKWAEDMMTRLNVAYSVISDARKRGEYDALRRTAQSAGVSVSDIAEGAGVKCFNHPKATSTGFCFYCGRPICDLCRSPRHRHPTCVVCERLASRPTRPPEREPREEPPETAWPLAERPMGVLGVIAYYGIVIVIAAAVAATAAHVAAIMGADARHIYMALVVVALVFGLFMFRELTWRVICPRCRRANGRVHFRASSTWGDFFSPNTACVRCEYWFTAEELQDAFR